MPLPPGGGVPSGGGMLPGSGVAVAAAVLLLPGVVLVILFAALVLSLESPQAATSNKLPNNPKTLRRMRHALNKVIYERSSAYTMISAGTGACRACPLLIESCERSVGNVRWKNSFGGNQHGVGQHIRAGGVGRKGAAQMQGNAPACQRLDRARMHHLG